MTYEIKKEKKLKMSGIHSEDKICMYLLSLFAIGVMFSLLGINIDKQLKTFNGVGILTIVSLIVIVNTVHKERKALGYKEKCIEYDDTDVLNAISAMLLFVGLMSIHNRVTCEIIVICNLVFEQLLRRLNFGSKKTAE